MSKIFTSECQKTLHNNYIDNNINNNTTSFKTAQIKIENKYGFSSYNQQDMTEIITIAPSLKSKCFAF